MLDAGFTSQRVASLLHVGVASVLTVPEQSREPELLVKTYQQLGDCADRDSNRE